jgi:hypothetical protein
MASYTYGHSYSVNDGTSSVAYSNWKYNYSVDTNHPELSYSLFDKPHKVNAVLSYTTPRYFGGRASTNFTVTYTGGSGQRYSYTFRENVDYNGDGYSGNSLMYIPTMDELTKMSWADGESARKFEKFIRQDPYLSANRGQWSTRYAGIAPWENHVDLHVSENIFYDKAKKRKVEITADIVNVTNLLNRAWGIYYASAYNRQVLNVTAITGIKGRWQTVRTNPLVICDIGHNVAAWEQLVKQINGVECRQKHIVFGIVDDKDIYGIMNILPKDAIYYFTKPSTKRALSEQSVLIFGQQLGLAGNSYPTVAEAFSAAMIAAGTDDFIFVGGSNYVVSDFLKTRD